MAAQETLPPFPLIFGPLPFSSLIRGGVQDRNLISARQFAFSAKALEGCGRMVCRPSGPPT
jgi:hypothetical protein